MAIYAIWNNKGGVGKSYLSFQIAAEYARSHPAEKILIIDLCPQANSSSMFFGGIENGEKILNQLGIQNPRRTISGYVEERISSPYVNPQKGALYVMKVAEKNSHIPTNVFLVPGDEQLEIQASRVLSATNPGPKDAWRIVHTWIRDLITDIKTSWNQQKITVFIDCNPSFSIYTELALSAADRLIIPFSADGSSRRAVRSVLALIYGITRLQGGQQSEYFINCETYGMSIPRIYCYAGNRLTQFLGSAKAFRTIVREIGDEVWSVWKSNPNLFYIHPSGAGSPKDRHTFEKMFQFEIVDANTASVVSSSLGIPIVEMTAGEYTVLGKNVKVNQSQLNKQKPNIQTLVAEIE